MWAQLISKLSSNMLDLSRASLEYVCKHVTSPNIARRFGHKLDQKDQKEECIGTLQVDRVLNWFQLCQNLFFNNFIVITMFVDRGKKADSAGAVSNSVMGMFFLGGGL